jgi:hypothetical protein
MPLGLGSSVRELDVCILFSVAATLIEIEEFDSREGFLRLEIRSEAAIAKPRPT